MKYRLISDKLIANAIAETREKYDHISTSSAVVIDDLVERLIAEFERTHKWEGFDGENFAQRTHKN